MVIFLRIHIAGTFAQNPQFYITVTDSDPYDDDDLCTVIIAVLQKYRRELKAEGFENLAIGFALYDVLFNFLEKSSI